MLKIEVVRLSTFDGENPVFQQLFKIFRTTLNPVLSYKEFRVYYFYHLPHFIDISFLKANGEIVGFISACFFKHQFSGKEYTICRGAIGVMEKYRRGCLSGWQLCLKYIAYKYRHPFENIYVTGFITNPLMYSIICKYSRQVYPKRNMPVPDNILRLKDDLFQLYRLKMKEVRPFVVKLHFHVPISATDLERIYASKDKDLLYYLSINEKFTDCEGMFMLVPVNWPNLYLSIARAVVLRPIIKSFRKSAARFRQQRPRLMPLKHSI